MGTRNRTKSSALTQLELQPQTFDFFQAIRLLSRSSNNIIFKTLASFKYPIAPIDHITVHHDKNSAFFVCYVTFMGLFGQSAILPDHYTELLLQRLQAKDTTFCDFLDLFNHPIISLFYNAWLNSRLDITYEQALYKGKKNDKLSIIMSALSGLLPYQSDHSLNFPECALFRHASLLFQNPRSPSCLQAILLNYFQLPVTILEFQGQWIKLQPGDRSKLTYTTSQSNYNQLNINTFLGDKILDLQSKFRISLGPLNYNQFLSCLPNGDVLLSLHHLTRYIVGIEYDYDIQLRLIAAEVPCCQINLNQPLRLGFTTWLCKNNRTIDPDDIILQTRTLPL